MTDTRRSDINLCIQLRMCRRMFSQPATLGGQDCRSASLSAFDWIWLDHGDAPLQGMAAAGYTITITGHSLGAGAAAMIGLLLRKRGVKVS